MHLYLGSLAGLLLILAAIFYVRRALDSHRYGDEFLNVSAGIAVAYAFVDVFPHLAKKQVIFDDFQSDSLLAYLFHHLYLVALVGFCMTVGVRAVQSTESRGAGDFSHWLLTLLLCLYSLLLGYMLAEQPVRNPEPALLFGLAMGAHMLGLSKELRNYAPRLYDGVVRYLLMASVTVGWMWGFFEDLTVRTYGLWFAFIAGCIVASSTLSDLPRISSARTVPAFFAGAVCYTALLLLVERLAA